MPRPANMNADDPIEELRAVGVRLSTQQERRLQWLSRTFGPLVSSANGLSTAAGRTLVVIDPPTGPGAELLYGRLTADDAVVIPFGENPAFDFLKSKLTEFGTVGACAAGPHELWWGGLGWKLPEAASARDAPRVVCCHPSDTGDLHIYHLRRSLQRLGLPFDIEPIQTRRPDVVSTAEKIAFIQRMWRRHAAPLLFVAPDVMLQSVPSLPLLAGRDFGAHKWNGWEMSARTLYFGQSSAAEMLLSAWGEIASSYPDVWEGYLIDQAWSSVSSQLPLDTIWLPRSYHAVAGEPGAGNAVIVHNLNPSTVDLGPDPSFAEMVRSARHAGRAGGRDPLLVLRSDAPRDKAISIILRDEGGNARDAAASVEALASAFTNDHGGFSRLEISLCAWQRDVRVAREAGRLAGHEVIVLASGQELQPDLFRALAAAKTSRQPTNIDARGR
ncbi:conserved hypothetical protein [Bradyrhizobium sp. ORS 278]|uniref:hypothetical protein n=1 Tax=Bradyrhizobium sp. (strain ORS 278) TaxID=114615 RepID=UPI0001508AC1|nr:hypothetical protein [Bradyrhizobium sp. ORS 278]CAL78606.1 conserved hypothetical protein [Bradyrhizobium sp. ORS 278]